ncbi:MAG TPA: UxaA family hydrolase, partial [bacterium]|nr:UxaA family hydrolase [bacterium]
PPSAARPAVLLLDARDTAAVAVTPIQPGAAVEVRRGSGTVRVVAETLIPFGHKIAVASMGAGDPVVKYGEVIGYATTPIRPGQHVHVHNVRSDRAKLTDG